MTSVDEIKKASLKQALKDRISILLKRHIYERENDIKVVSELQIESQVVLSNLRGMLNNYIDHEKSSDLVQTLLKLDQDIEFMMSLAKHKIENIEETLTKIESMNR